MINKIHLILILLAFVSCKQRSSQHQENKKTDEYIDLVDFNINKIKAPYFKNHTFSNATFDSGLTFQPTVDYDNYYGNTEYRGNVKTVTEYLKYSDSYSKEFSSVSHYNKNGYKIKTESKGNHISNYYYDSENNIIKKERIVNNDTIFVTKLAYNEKKQLVNINQENFKKDEISEFDKYVTIKYNKAGNPILYKNDHPIKKHAFVINIVYDGNIVTLSKTKENIIVAEEIYVYSEKNNLIKQKFGYHTIFFEYNKENQNIKKLTYRNDEYCCTDSYNYNKNGDRVNWIFTNHLKNYKELHKYEIKYDSLRNKIYEYSSDNATNNTYEYFYEIEYY